MHQPFSYACTGGCYFVSGIRNKDIIIFLHQPFSYACTGGCYFVSGIRNKDIIIFLILMQIFLILMEKSVVLKVENNLNNRTEKKTEKQQ